MGVFFKMMPKKGADAGSADEGDSEGGFIPMMKPFWVFNVADIENLPEVEDTRPEWGPLVFSAISDGTKS
jgi:antirestriction protein ArdC